jgi:hypothetical protein
MLNQEEIDYQQERLATYRRALTGYLEQFARTGTRPSSGITAARAEIARIKETLRNAGVQVDDHADDIDQYKADDVDQNTKTTDLLQEFLTQYRQNTKTTASLQELLTQYRRTLAEYLEQFARTDGHNALPDLLLGIRETSEQIAYIKAMLRDVGVLVDNQTNDNVYQDIIASLQELLTQYRRTLAKYLVRPALLSVLHSRDIRQIREEIARIKATLHSMGVRSDNHADDKITTSFAGSMSTFPLFPLLIIVLFTITILSSLLFVVRPMNLPSTATATITTSNLPINTARPTTPIPSASLTPMPTPTNNQLLQQAAATLMDGLFFFNPPQEMKVNAPEIVTFRLEYGSNVITSTISEGLPTAERQIITETIQISSRMRASLTGASFIITPLHSDEEKMIFPNAKNDWSWLVQPTQPGTHTLILRLSTVIEAGQDKAPFDLPIREKQVIVQVDWGIFLSDIIKTFWVQIVAVVGGLSAAAKLLYEWIKKRRRRRRHRGRR